MLHFQQASSSNSNTINKGTHPDNDADMEYDKMSMVDASETNHHPIAMMNDEEWMEAMLTPSNGPALFPNFGIAHRWDSATIIQILQLGMKVDMLLGALALVLHAVLMELVSPNGKNSDNSVGRF